MKLDILACANDGQILGSTTVDAYTEDGRIYCLVPPKVVAIASGVLIGFKAYSPDLDLTINLGQKGGSISVSAGSEMTLLFDNKLMVSSYTRPHQMP